MALENIDELVALVREDVVTVACVFDSHLNAKQYTFLATKDVIDGAQEGDYALVDTSNGIKASVIARVDDHLDTSLLSRGLKYKYVYGVVTQDSVDKLRDQNDAIAKQIEQCHARTVKAKALQLLGIGSNDVLLIRKQVMGEVK